jgi:hypothetical protein
MRRNERRNTGVKETKRNGRRKRRKGNEEKWKTE